MNEVRLVGDNVEQGVYPFSQALRMAEAMGLDLVEISGSAVPPVCRIIEYKKFLYDLKKKPQVPSIHAWYNGYTYERADAAEAHYKGIFDDEGRMMVIICHNTDLGDGWEREGMDPQYFKEMSEKWSYPMGINIIVYAMTH